MDPAPRPTILIAGIGGASLGTELMKCLALAKRYSIIGCDVSDQAFGHFAGVADDTRTVRRDRYVEDVLAYAVERGVAAVIAGAGEPLRRLHEARGVFAAAGVEVVGNNAETIELAEDKCRIAQILDSAGVCQPKWVSPRRADDPALEIFPNAVVIKPATNSGASRFVFLAEDRKAASAYIHYLLQNGQTPMVQDYIPLEEGEFSIGALSGRDGAWIGAIIMKRIFINELSIAARTHAGLISSPYGQGRFGSFPEIEREARKIAEALGSTGPLNVQGRVRDGQFFAFEVNARFSGSCFLRAMAGFNEPDLVLRDRLFGETVRAPTVAHGLAVRSLSEVFIPDQATA